MAEASTAGEVYASLVESALKSEEDRRKAIEGRAGAILTTSSTMLALILGLTVIVTGKDYVYKNHWSLVLLLVALVAFVMSAGLAIVVQAFGFKYKVISAATLSNLTDDVNWHRTPDARRMWVTRQVATTQSVRTGNNTKATLAIWSLAFELAAIAMLALAVGVELHTRF
ncbi:hypothetical protein ACNO8X_27185 [Mycobacterium sp. PDNC021]|uniref:hypothetical protein n=1 Tax=Mycobacterium sp. PDNC021 TaxID=3391399 RepID=UPI003AAC1F43